MRLGCRILGELRFIENQGRPLDAVVRLEVQAEQRIRGDDDARADDRLGERATGLLLRCGDLESIRPGQEAFGFADPARHHRRRSNHEKGARVGVGLDRMGDERERLHGFSEPHVVGEDAAEFVPVQEHEPVEALLLVGAQLGRKSSR